MTTFILILVLLDSMQFGFAAKPRLRKVAVSVPRAVATGSSAAVTGSSATIPPNCTADENGEPTCYPIDQSDKFRR